ncbi:Predicted kinase, aminoglycoside phosphotransferase (APT) family [Actinokineospora alba]|uniref:Predicted kinase, aminoglycoside phosphotransferase (APT) family n=1 Tax=Actinokineospora alba TaxID=504798 RepID=A0A1H0LKS4_9PSEU|nr:aminoglycoside phosphotransferase family protein [Actinokineospora alba]TDP67364.1 aminoglycoside phosphotransferase (APT) family kinase protein [Actinokineospora alba]SDI98750.1 Predicted kinase, aminoglycoside phosphotransferase (APT) family [Actinokineospora alba]SDO68817.1 Predicted kinase, aminoglycoside phosphotransferase (APT) family [Actinokineospora alba]
MGSAPADGRAGIDASLVKRLVSAQFPQWSDLAVTPVEVDGWDNRTYRLGDDLTVRLPTAAGYVPAVAKENRWLPRLASSLPVTIPVVLAEGVPGEGYPFPWSVRRWVPGETADPKRVDDLSRFAISVAEFLLALQRCDPTDGPLGGAHSWYRGCSPAHYDEDTRRFLDTLTGHVDTARAAAVWEDALAAEITGPPVWFHGDVAVGNLLVAAGKLTAVIDFGTCGVGDPACDLVIAWTMFSGASREAFREVVDLDKGTWARARGWALWKALLILDGCLEDDDHERAAINQRVIDEVLADHDSFG